MLITISQQPRKYRLRGRPRKAREDGPTPELMLKRQEFSQKWQVHHPKTLTRCWWHIFFSRGDISLAEFRLSQDYSSFRTLGKQLNQDHKPWHCVLNTAPFTSRSSLSDDQRTQISQWWHEWLHFSALFPESKFLETLYATSAPWQYDPRHYLNMRTLKDQALQFLKERWIFRRVFIEMLEL